MKSSIKKRAAICCGISKHNDRVPKVEEQEALCRRTAKAADSEVVMVYVDDGISASKGTGYFRILRKRITPTITTTTGMKSQSGTDESGSFAVAAINELPSMQSPIAIPRPCRLARHPVFRIGITRAVLE